MLRHLFYMFLLSPLVLFSQSYSGKIVKVIDGDIILFQTGDTALTVHLYGIDAPEKGQYYSYETIDYLEKYLWAEAKIQMKRGINKDDLIAVLFIRGNNINKELVKNGYAYYNRPQCVSAELARAEEYAKEKKLGIWKNKNAVSPWEFKEGVLPKPPPTDGKIKVLICADSDDNHYHKQYCPELQSCHGNVIVILRKQARSIHMKPCKFCY